MVKDVFVNVNEMKISMIKMLSDRNFEIRKGISVFANEYRMKYGKGPPSPYRIRRKSTEDTLLMRTIRAKNYESNNPYSKDPILPRNIRGIVLRDLESPYFDEEHSVFQRIHIIKSVLYIQKVVITYRLLRRTRSAVSIQSHWRGYCTRKTVLKQRLHRFRQVYFL